MPTKKCAMMVVESCGVTFAISCSEQSCHVGGKGNTVERQTEVSASCLLCCERFIVLADDGDDSEQRNV